MKPVNGKATQKNLTHAAMLSFGLMHILDYGDLIIAPGLIDTHVHMDQPGRTNWEGVNALRSALAFCLCTVSDHLMARDPAVLLKHT